MQASSAPLVGPCRAARETTCRKTDYTQPAHAAEIKASRRNFGLQLISAAAAAALAAPRPAAAAAASASLTPYQRGLQLEYGLTREGRIPSCPSDANPNCVSTSSTNATYMPAWEAPQGSPADAMAQFEAALAAAAPSARVVAAASAPTSEYRRFQVDDPLFNHDDIEVLIAVQRPPYESEPPLVTFRSMAAEVKYVWPIQQAVTDFGAQRQRLKEVRQRLGWRILGCDLLECFEE